MGLHCGLQGDTNVVGHWTSANVSDITCKIGVSIFHVEVETTRLLRNGSRSYVLWHLPLTNGSGETG